MKEGFTRNFNETQTTTGKYFENLLSKDLENQEEMDKSLLPTKVNQEDTLK